MATAEALLTAEEFGSMPDDGRMTELVRGRIVDVPPSQKPHGKVCFRIARFIGNQVEDHDLGHVFINDTGVVTERDPDTVRGADVFYISYARMPKDHPLDGYADIPPDLVFEVRSPSDRWPEIMNKVGEYLAMGVPVVCVLDPEARSARLFRPDRPVEVLGPEDELTFPECLGDFRVMVRRFFE